MAPHKRAEGGSTAEDRPIRLGRPTSETAWARLAGASDGYHRQAPQVAAAIRMRGFGLNRNCSRLDDLTCTLC
jgi:hypothetical protein